MGLCEARKILGDCGVRPVPPSLLSSPSCCVSRESPEIKYSRLFVTLITWSVVVCFLLYIVTLSELNLHVDMVTVLCCIIPPILAAALLSTPLTQCLVSRHGQADWEQAMARAIAYLNRANSDCDAAIRDLRMTTKMLSHELGLECEKCDFLNSPGSDIKLPESEIKPPECENGRSKIPPRKRHGKPRISSSTSDGSDTFNRKRRSRRAETVNRLNAFIPLAIAKWLRKRKPIS